MDFFKGIGNFFGNLFGGNKEDEEKKKRQQQQAQSQPLQKAAPQAQAPAQQRMGAGFTMPQAPNNQIALPQLLTKAQPQQTAPKPDSLDALTQQELGRAMEDEKKQTSWFDRTFTDRDWNKRAENLARSRALSKYGELHGYGTPEARAFGAETGRRGDELVESARKGVERLDKVAEVTNKIGQAAQYVPVTGSIINLGLAGAEATNLGGMKDDYRNTRNKLDFDMTTEQYNMLDDETKKKLEILRGAGLALSPLDFVGVGGLAKTGLVKAGKQAVVEGVTQGAVKQATKEALKQGAVQTAKNIAIPTAAGTAVSAGAQQYLSGEVDPLEAIKSGLLVGGTSQFFSGKLAKASPNEVADGVTSVNPTREADIVVDAEQKAAKEAADAEAAAIKAAEENPAVKAPATATPPVAAIDTPPAPVTPEVTPPVTPPVTNTIESIMAQGDTELNAFKQANPAATPQQISRAQAAINAKLVEQVRALQAEQAAPPVASVEQTTPPPQAAEVPPAEASRATEVPEAPTSGEAAPVEAAPAVPAPEMPSAIGEPVGTAPRTHDALVKQVAMATGDEASQQSMLKRLKNKYMPRVPDNIDELKQKAAGVIANMSDEDLRNNFAATSVDDMVTNTNELALARAALDRLAQLPDDEVAVQMVKNILDGMEKYVSKSGSALRFIQEDFDAMPMPMKVKYISKHIDSANKETPGYIPLSQDRARAELVEGQITAHLKASEAIAVRVAETEGKLNAVTEAAKNGEASPENITTLVKDLQADKRALEANNGELVKYYQTLVPKRSVGQRVFSDFPRMAMLSSFAGRVNDVITTSMNVANLGLENTTRGLLAKAVNFFAPGKATDTLRGTRQFGEGTVEGVRRGAAEFGGTQFTGDLQKALTDNTGLRSGLQKATGPVSRTVQAATEFATNASQGVRDQRLYQLAVKEAQQQGIDPKLVDQYARSRAAVPSRVMLENAEQLRLEVNNLNANPVTHVLNRVASSIEGKSAVGGFLKNQIIPFTSWLGGNIWNTITDKNVVANATKIIGSASKGDVDGVIRNLSKFGNNAAQTYALGYVLTQAGLITNENAEGYNDAGAYLHVGDRYIPVGFFGFFAPNIILGNAAYQGLNSDGTDGQDAVTKTIDTAVSNIFRHVALNDVMGMDNNLGRAADTFKNSESIIDAGAQFAANAAGQFIPGLAGDANAILNMSPLNPTGEKSETKVVDPNSPSGQAKDVPKTAANQFLNRLPVYSQLGFPRKEGVAAADVIDRVTRGSHDTVKGKAEKQQKLTDAEAKKDREKRGIPETEAGIEAKWQNGDFDAAIEGTKYRMAEAEKKGELSKSDKDRFDTDIRRMETLRDKKISYEDWATYNKMTLEDWRNLGDEESDSYDPKLYQKLFDIDAALTAGKASDSSKGNDVAKYFAKKKKTGSGRGSSDPEGARIRSNTIGSVPNLSKIDFGALRPEKAGSKPMPIIRQPRSSELVKKRKISVARAR